MNPMAGLPLYFENHSKHVQNPEQSIQDCETFG